MAGYSIGVSYPNGKYLPDNSDHSFISIISNYSARIKGRDFIKTINQIFDGEADLVFGGNRYIEHGDPEHIILSAKKWQ